RVPMRQFAAIGASISLQSNDKISSSTPSGAIAQLGERIVRNDEVVGSIPTSSTNTPKPLPEPLDHRLSFVLASHLAHVKAMFKRAFQVLLVASLVASTLRAATGPFVV